MISQNQPLAAQKVSGTFSQVGKREPGRPITTAAQPSMTRADVTHPPRALFGRELGSRVQVNPMPD